MEYSSVFNIEVSWFQEVGIYTVVSSFKGVGIELFHCVIMHNKFMPLFMHSQPHPNVMEGVAASQRKWPLPFPWMAEKLSGEEE